MYPKKDLFRSSWMVLWRVPVRALFVGALAAAAAGLFGAVCGSFLGLAMGSVWVGAASWGIRGAFAGLAAGAIVGALSGVYHVEESARQTISSRPSSPPLEESQLPSARPSAALDRNGLHSKQSGDGGHESAGKAFLRGRQMLFPAP
jgi:hypothetical protein